MTSKRFLLGMSVLVLGMTVISCGKLTGMGSGSTTVTDKRLVGVWELESFENQKRNQLLVRIEFFSDGTGIVHSDSNIKTPGDGITWQVRDGNRLQISHNTGSSQIHDVELSEKGKLLTFFPDGRNNDTDKPRKSMWRKKQ